MFHREMWMTFIRLGVDDEVLDGARIVERCRLDWKGMHGHA